MSRHLRGGRQIDRNDADIQQRPASDSRYPDSGPGRLVVALEPGDVVAGELELDAAGDCLRRVRCAAALDERHPCPILMYNQ